MNLKKDLNSKLDDHLSLYANLPAADVEESQRRVFKRLQSRAAVSLDDRPSPIPQIVRKLSWRSRRWLVAVAAAAILITGVRLVWLRSLPPSVAHAVDGSLYRVEGAKRLPLRQAEEIRTGEIIDADGARGAVIATHDGSRIELRSDSELTLENASDGLRIRLNLGGVIVNAAPQRTGHLYVQTKDVTVSVTGTVFLVNAEEEGSLVAVIEGEVHIQQGAEERRLRPGQQVSTNPRLKSQPVSSEIAWSRNVEAHIALLQETTAEPSIAPPVQYPKESQSFAAASIKPVAPGASSKFGFVCKGVDGVRRTYEGTEGAPNAPIAVQGRCVGSGIYVAQLIGLAYGVAEARQVGPKWAVPGGRTPAGVPPEPSPEGGLGARYQIEAAADNPDTVTADELIQMTRTMLADRFKLKLHRETEDAPGYALVVDKKGPAPELKAVADTQERPVASLYNEKGIPVTTGRTTMEGLARWLSGNNRGLMPVVDKTALSGLFEYQMVHTPPPTGGDRGGRPPTGERPAPPSVDDMRRNMAESLWGPRLMQLGLRLREEKAVPVEIIVIDHIERPSGN